MPLEFVRPPAGGAGGTTPGPRAKQPLPEIWPIPVVACAVWIVVFMAVALWRFGREEF